MALSSLWKHRKFRQLVAALKSRALAAGVLECMWSCGQETGDDLLGTSDDVEEACGWSGKHGALTPLLEKIGWVDVTHDGYRIHDFFDHCPRYVKRRIARRAEDSQRAASDRPVTGQRPAGDRQYPTQPNPTVTQPNPPPSPGPAGERASGFAEFWQAYPRKVGREAALRAWISTGAAEHADAIADALTWQVQLPEWQRDGGRFVPKPENYLFERRWTDERPRDPFLDADDAEGAA